MKHCETLIKTKSLQNSHVLPSWEPTHPLPSSTFEANLHFPQVGCVSFQEGTMFLVFCHGKFLLLLLDKALRSKIKLPHHGSFATGE